MKLILSLFLILMLGCTDDKDDSSSENQENYSGPGSFWSASIGSSTFTMERAPTYGGTVDLTVNGTVSTLASGYKVFTVTSATGTNAPSAGEQAYGFVVPGFFTLVKPMNSSDDQLLPMLAAGNCPSTDINYNWIVTDYKGSNNLATTADIVGVANFVNSTTSFTISQQYSLDGTDVFTTAQTFTGSCSSGFMQIDTNSDTVLDTDMWLSSSGAALVKTPEDTIIVAMPAESFTSTSLASKSFYGLVFNEADTSQKVRPVWIDFNAGGTVATGGTWSDITAGTKGNAQSEITFASFGSPATGFVQATLAIDTDDNGSFDQGGGNIICQFKSNLNSSGKDMLFCAGHTGASTTEMFNVLLISE